MSNYNFSANDFGGQKENYQPPSQSYRKIFFVFFIVFIFLIFTGFLVWGILSTKRQNLLPPTVNNEENKEKPSHQQNSSLDYYDILAQKCQKCPKYSLADCLKSVEIMRQNNYREPNSQGSCPPGYRKNTLRCPCCFSWCELTEGK